MFLQLQDSVNLLRDGKVILYPTDTVWGLGCDATNSAAIENVFNLKSRSAEKSLIVLVADINMLGRYFKTIPDVLFDLEENSNEPLTYVLDGATGIASNALHQDGSLAVRIPKNEFCKQLIRKFGKAIISTSANKSGDPTPLKFEEISIEITMGADGIVDPKLSTKATGKPSGIIKIKPNGEFTIIRK